MKNPWLNVPASDYEGHMGSPAVAQLQMLADIFAGAVDKYDTDSVALLGCATGNGLESVTGGVARRVTAIDINPGYLAILRERFGGSIEGLETIEADIESYELEESAYSLVFAGLLFEYVDPEPLLQKIAGWLRPGGVLVSVLQMSLAGSEKVSDTPYVTLKQLESSMNLVRPCQFRAMACCAGLTEIETSTDTLESGKTFFISVHTRENI